MFISPFYLLYAVFGLFPLLYGLWLSLHKWDGISKMQWIGAANYIKLMTDDIWWKAIYNTIWLFVGATIPQLIIALLLLLSSALPTSKAKFLPRRLLRTLTSPRRGGQPDLHLAAGHALWHAELCARLDRHWPG